MTDNDDTILHDDIREIQRLLSDSYNITGFPILKELIQNASDAGAETLNISVFNGIDGAIHPLLKNHRSLLVYNDGEFREKDRKNIRYISGTGKAKDETSVGKFGVGMKSVFHLCDMFFYSSVIIGEDTKGQNETRNFNPWPGNKDGEHSEWDSFHPEDRNLIQKYFSAAYNNKGFLLILPLKIEPNEPHISKNNIFPDGIGEYFGPENELAENIQKVLPLLDYVSSKRPKPSLKTISIDIPGYFQNSVTLASLKDSYVSCKASEDSVYYPSLQQEAKKIICQNIWPDAEKKPGPDTACTIVRLPKNDEKKYITLVHAVFLPLEHELKYCVDTQYSYAIMIHGEFAIDSGRKNIKEFERIADPLPNLEEPIADVNEAYKIWNKFLAQRSLYPLIPKILNKGINEKIIDKDDIDEFLKGFKNLLKNNNINIDKYITAKYGFAKIFKNKKISWGIFPSDKKVFILPENYPNNFDENLLREIDNGILVSSQDGYFLDGYFLKENGDDNIPLIIKCIQKDLSPEHERYFENYIDLISRQGRLFPGILYNNPDLPVIQVKRISIDTREVIYVSFNDVKNYQSRKILFLADNQYKFAELYRILSGEANIYIIDSDKYSALKLSSSPVTVNKADNFFIRNNLNCFPQKINFSSFDSFKDEVNSLVSILNNDQFCRLPIHKIRNINEYSSISLKNSYRGPNQRRADFPPNFKFPDDKIFLENHPLDAVRIKENDIIPELSQTEKIRIYFNEREKITNTEELDWLLDNFDYNNNQELLSIITSKEWIPVYNTADNIIFIKPGFIYSRDIVNAGTIDKIRNEFHINGYYKETDIVQQYRDKIKNTGVLNDINSKQSFLERLAKSLSDPNHKDKFLLFPIVDPCFDDRLFLYTKILALLPCQFLYKLIEILYEDKNFTPPRQIADHFYNNLTIRKFFGNSTHYIESLKCLCRQDLNDNSISIFNVLLEGLINCGDFNISLLKEFKYPVESNEWQDPAWVIFDPEEKQDNIPPKHKVNKIINSILNLYKSRLNAYFDIEIPGGAREQLNSNSDIDSIHKFFSPWIAKGINQKILGFLLYIMRGNFQKAAVEKFNFDQQDIIIINNEMPYEMPKDCWNENIGIENVFSKGKGFFVTISTEQKMEFISIGGEPRQFSESFNSRVACVSRLEITVTESLKDLSGSDIKKIIKNILILGYFQVTSGGYDPFFEKISNSNSNYLEWTQDILFNGIYYILKQLSLLNVPEFKKFTEDYDNFSRKNKNAIPQDLIKDIRKKIISETPLQDAIRKSIIRQLSNSQYDTSSIPFELFQNADDALVERIEHGKNINNQIPEEQMIFIVENHENNLAFKHFGREINRAYDEKDSAYIYDLENMLSLHSSYKNNDKETGKFGLGFKSVYFICDEPVIRSGDLQLKIIGGFYPEKIEKYAQLKSNETKIELLPRNDVNIENVLHNFKINAPFQAVFGKAIHNISIFDKKYIWSPENQLAQNAKIDNSIFFYNIETGRADVDDYLKLTMHKNQKHFVSLLFKYNKETKKILPINNDEISKIWNTTPLQNDKKLNFAINADFRVDLGRKTVVQDLNNNKHEMMLREAGEALGIILDKEGESLARSIFDVIVPSNRSETLKVFPSAVLGRYYKLTNKLPTGTGRLIAYSEEHSYYYLRDDHNDFEIKYGQNHDFQSLLNSFINNNIKGAYFIVYQAYECWKAAFERMEFKEPVAVSDIFSLLNELNVTPEISQEFAKILEKIKIKRTNISPNFKLRNKENEWFSIPYCLNYEQSLSEISDQDYSPQFISYIEQYFKDKLYKQPEYSIQPPVPTSHDIKKVFDWWKSLAEDEKKEKIKLYEETLFPGWYNPNTLKDDKHPDYKMNWMVLYIIAVCQQLGRVGDSQTRGFVEKLKDNGWLEIMSRSSDLTEWMKIVMEYFEGNLYDQKYLSWMNYMLQFYVIRYHLEDYILVFSQLDRLTGDINLENINAVESNAALSGSGIHAPSLNRTLKTGSSFIIRELLRSGILKPHSNIIEHAFIPHLNTRKIIMNNEEECPSALLFSEISKKLNMENYTFEGYYDIPVILYCKEHTI